MRATRSKDGALRVTVRVEVRVNAEVLDWLRERVGARKAAAGLRRAVIEHGRDGLAWQAIGVLAGEVVTMHVDDVSAGTAIDGFEPCPHLLF